MFLWKMGSSFSRKQTCSGIVTKRNLISDKVICLSVTKACVVGSPHRYNISDEDD